MDHAERVQATADLSAFIQKFAKVLAAEKGIDEVLVAGALMHAATQLFIDHHPVLEVADWIETQGRDLRIHAPMLAPTGGTA